MTVEIKRDRFGRPLIIPPGGGKPEGYTRVSTLAKALDDGTALVAWKQRMTLVGTLLDEGIRAEASTLINRHADPVGEASKALGVLAHRAMERAGATRAASLGTTVHELTERMDNGQPITHVPDGLGPVLDAYTWGMAGLEVIESEVFVVVDDIACAGTLDCLVRLPGGRVVVADKKTGRNEPAYAGGVTTQCAAYARGQRYDPATGERTPLHHDLDPTTGLLIHIPLLPVDGRQVCDLFVLDLTLGWERALLAHQVRAARKHPKLTKWSAA